MSGPSNQPNAAALLEDLRQLTTDEQVRRLEAIDTHERLLLALADEAARLTSRDAETAVEMTEMVCRLADRFDYPLARARARRAKGRAYAYGGQYDAALLVCEEAATIAGDSGEVVEAARARLASMHALTELGRLSDAVDVGENARDRLMGAGRPELAARAEINLGVVHQRRDEPARAVECFDRARGPLASEPLLLGHIDNNRGEALLALNQFAEAEVAFRQALQAYDTLDSPITAAIAEGNLADLATRQGHLHAALHHFERARRRFETNRSPVHLARLLAEQAEAKAILGLPREALAEYEHVVSQLHEHGLALEAARARAGMGLVLLRLRRFAEAETALAAAATAFQDLGHDTSRAKVDLARAELMLGNGRHADAESLAHRAMASLVSRPADGIGGRHLLARLALAQGEPRHAIHALEAAIDHASHLDLPPLLVDLLSTRGRVWQELGENMRAAKDLSRAVTCIEKMRGALQAERFRIALLGDRSEIYERLVHVLLEDDETDVTAAFNITEKAKSRSLLEQVQPMGIGQLYVHTNAEDPAVEQLQRQGAELQGELNGLYSRVADDLHADQPPRVLRALRQRISDCEHELESIQGRIAMSQGCLGGVMAPTATLQRVQECLAPGQKMIEYFSIGQQLVAFVIGPHGAVVHRGLGRVEQVDHHLGRLGFQIDKALRPGASGSRRFGRMLLDTQRELSNLYQLLIEPLVDDLEGSERLTIVPHGPLHLVPFHALYGNGAYLLESFCIHTVPSASILQQMAAIDSSPAAENSLVVGVADEVAPRIAEEAVAVARTLGGKLILAEDATVEAFLREVDRPLRTLHLACHGSFVSGHAASSGLELYDRWLTVRDIYELRINADLVTLSGCETGRSHVQSGDELVGLVRGFLSAGARSMMVTIWPADDAVAAELMCHFYRRWNPASQSTPGSVGQVNAGVASVLRQVQLDALQEHPHPAHWAPFVLVGQS